MQVLISLAHSSTVFSPDLQVLGPQMFRGDSWQMLISEPQFALHLALYLRAGLKSQPQVDTRIAIGLGTIEALPNNDLGNANGTAFRLSGNALDDMKRNQTLACKWAISETSSAAQQTIFSFFQSALLFTGRLASQWSVKEAWAVYHVLQGVKQQEIANEWPDGATTQQNVANTLRRASWTEIDALLNAFYTAIENNNIDL